MKYKIEQISSVQNPLVKKMALLKHAKHRKESNLCIAEGVRTITTLVQSGLVLDYLFATNEHEKLAYSLAQSNTTIVLSTDQVLAKISSATTSSGLLAFFRQPVYTVDQLKGPGLVLAQISDPGNMGTLIRSAAAFNAKTVVIVEGVDPWSPKVIQASVGTIGMVHLFLLSWQELVKFCAQKKILLNALVVDGANAQQQHSTINQLLVVGNEAHGLSMQWQKDCQLKTTIAMQGKTESLNAAVAGSIALHEMTKK